MTAKSGKSIFTGLNRKNDVVTTEGEIWHYMMSNSENPYYSTIPFTRFKIDDNSLDGVHYIYVGSWRNKLTGVNISVTATGADAVIEFQK